MNSKIEKLVIELHEAIEQKKLLSEQLKDYKNLIEENKLLKTPEYVSLRKENESLKKRIREEINDNFNLEVENERLKILVTEYEGIHESITYIHNEAIRRLEALKVENERLEKLYTKVNELIGKYEG